MSTRAIRQVLIFIMAALLGCSGTSAGNGDGNGNDAGNGDDDGNGDEIDWENINVEIEGDYAPEATMGPKTPNEYNPDGENSDSVVTDQIGRLILNTENAGRHHLWVSNSDEGTVSNVDTELIKEVGRYHSGPSENADPSRTSVDLAGDVFVGNRGKPASVTKISADPGRCIDRNGNGTIETSTGPDDIYPRAEAGNPHVAQGYSTDECVVWTHVFDEDIPCEGARGVAATAETGVDFEYNGHVWIGCRDTNTIFKLNGASGEVMASYGPFDGTGGQLNVSPYGFVLDSENRLWVSGRGGGGDDAVYWMDVSNGKMIKAGSNQPKEPYGIALDDNDHIWIATKNEGSICRYIPGPPPALADGTWDCLQVTDSFRGIAVDIDGYVWAIDTSGRSEVYYVDPATFPASSSKHGPFFLGSDTVAAEKGTGMAIDFSGHVWGISTSGCMTAAGDMGCASRLKVDRSGGGLPEVASSADIVTVGEGPYVYSDMIGYNLRNFTTKEGWYHQTFDVCQNTSTKWEQIAFNSDVPSGTSFVIRARTADQPADLALKPWVTVVAVPDDASPVDLPSNLPQGHFIELEVRLYTQEEGVTPAIGQIGFSFECTYEVIIV